MSPWTQLASRLQREVLRAGWAGVAGLALLGFALSFEFSGNAERHDQLASLADARTALAARARQPASTQSSPREQLQQFQQRFTAASKLPEVLLALQKSARTQGLTAQRAEYAEASERLHGLRQIRISLPVKGSYAALRAWLDAALIEHPALSLDALEIQRKHMGDIQLDAQVRLTLFLRAD